MNQDRTSIVLVVERSLPMRHYIHEMLESYISPALNNFCGGLNEDSDVFFRQSSPVLFGVVFFGSESQFGSSVGQLTTVGPTPSIKDVLAALRGASYNCLNVNRQASIIEGLQSASVLFSQLDKISALRSSAASNSTGTGGSLGGSDVNSGCCKKFCILVTQSTPLQLPCSPTSLDQTLKTLKLAGVRLSVLGCHKLSELYRIFEAGGGDLNGALHKNYATRPNHLVLLAGFTLPEQDNPPPPPPAAASGLQTQPGTTNLGQQQPSPAAPGLAMNQSTQQQVGSSVAPGQVPVNVGSVGSPASLQQQQQQHHQQQQQNQQQSQIVQQQQQQLGQQQIRSSLAGMQQQQPNMPPLSQGSTIRCGVGGNVMRPNVMNTMGARARWQSPMTGGQQQQDPSMVAKAMQGNQMSQAALAQQQPQQAQQQQQQVQQQQQQNVNIPSALPSSGAVPRTTVWQGTLEFQEKKDGSNPGGMGRGMLQVPVKMNSQLQNGEPEVKTDGWPMNLVLQWIPKSIISGLGNSCLKQAHTVMFLPEPCPALTVLTNILSGLIAGCVYPSPSNPHVRMIILLFSAEKKAFVGFIPVDHQLFITKMKSVIHSQRTGGPIPRPGAPAIGGPAGSGGNMVGNNQMVPMGGGGLQQGGNVMAGNIIGGNTMAGGMSSGMPGNGGMNSGGGMVGPGSMSGGGAIGSGVGTMSGGPMGGGGTMGAGQCGMVGGGSVLANQLIRPTGNMAGMQQQQDQQPYQLRMPQQVVQGGGNMRALLAGPLGGQPGGGRGVMQPMGGQGSQRMMALQQQMQMQQQQQMLMMQQQGMRPNLGQGGMPQGAMGQVGMGQVMGQPGMGGALPPDGQDFMDMI